MLLMSLLCGSLFAKNFAVVIAGWTKDRQQAKIHHEFALDGLREATGLAKSGWETTLLYTAVQDRTQFHETGAVTERMRAENITTKYSSKAKLLETISALKDKVGRGDKVYLSVNAHGVKSNGTFV